MGVFLHIFGDVPMSHPRCDDCRHIVVVKHAIELEDVWARHVFPHDCLLPKTLFPIKSAHVRVLRFLPTAHTHLDEFRPTLLI